MVKNIKSEDKISEGTLHEILLDIKYRLDHLEDIEADNHESTLYFSVWNDDNEEGFDKDKYLQYAYETACVQHEIDHLDGYTMYDRELILEPLKRKEEKIGRNSKVIIKKGEETKTIKYKKFEKMQEDGWALAEV